MRARNGKTEAAVPAKRLDPGPGSGGTCPPRRTPSPDSHEWAGFRLFPNFPQDDVERPEMVAIAASSQSLPGIFVTVTHSATLAALRLASAP
jgi:hypothetical protein